MRGSITSLVLGLRAGEEGMMDSGEGPLMGFGEEPGKGFGDGAMVGLNDVAGCEVVGFRLRSFGVQHLCFWGL